MMSILAVRFGVRLSGMVDQIVRSSVQGTLVCANEPIEFNRRQQTET